MKVFRGPASTSFDHDSHVLVDTVQPEKLEEGIRSQALIRFNISKEVNDRQAVCTVRFEETDIVPMISGLLVRLSTQQVLLTKITSIMSGTKTSDEKVKAIQAAMKRKPKVGTP